MINVNYSKSLGFIIFCLAFALTMCGAASAAPVNSTHTNLSTSVNPTTTQLNTTATSNNINSSNSTGTTKLPDPQVYNGHTYVGTYNTIASAINAAQSGDTITLENGATFYENSLTINKNLNFNVMGNNGLFNGHATIDAQNNGYIFHIDSVTVNLNGLTLANGTGDNGFGGAILNEGSLTINNCTFENNRASNGGAIDNYVDCNLIVSNTSFVFNTADEYGGAIRMLGRDHIFNINNCTFFTNMAKQGGAIFNDQDQFFTVSNSTFTTNIATDEGGAIDEYGPLCALNVLGSNFTGNLAYNQGGAIFNGALNNLTIVNSNFTKNNAKGGTNITNIVGGAIESGWFLTVISCNFTSNYASGFGGAIDDGIGRLIVLTSYFTSNTANEDGGAIYNNMAPMQVTGSVFKNNSANLYDGGAIFVFKTGNNAIITGSTFTGNTADGTLGEGGAIQNVGGALTILSSSFNGNKATHLGGDGGAIMNLIASNLTVIECTFTENIANDWGGAIMNAGILNLTGSTLTFNLASEGGALYNDGTAAVHFNRIVNNTVTMVGEGIYNDGKVNATLNWWGNNDNKKWIDLQLAGDPIIYNPWIVLTITANPKNVPTGSTSAITADLLHDNTGKYYNPVNGVVPYNGSANFKTNMGSILNYGITLNFKLVPKIFANGQVTSSLFGLASSEVATVSSTVDDCTVSTPVTVKDGPIAVTSINPGSGATNVPVNQKITVTFSEPNGLPLTEGNAWGSISVKNSNGSVPQISTVLNGDTLTITRVSGTYTPGDTYIVSIPVNAVVDTAGNGLAAAYTSSFTATLLGVKSIDPANGATNVPNNQKITVTFSEPIKQGSAYTSISVKNSNGSVPQINTSFSGDVLTITRVSGNYTLGDTYVLNIPVNAVTDSAGNTFTPAYTSSFTITTT